MLSRIGEMMVAGGFLAMMCIGGQEDYEFALGVTSGFIPLAIKTMLALAVMAIGVKLSGGVSNGK